MNALHTRRPPGRGALDLWRFSLDRVPATTSALSAEERARASRFRFEHDARRFVAGRAALRSILAGYCECAPSALELVTNEQGKPALADAARRRLWFNLAHSDHQALVLVGAHEHIGVDVEIVRAGFADDEIAERFFAPPEVSALRSLPLDQQVDAFFRCWTRKESYIKARGGGLHIPLDSFTVAFVPGEEPALTWVEHHPGEPDVWTVGDVSDSVPGCIAAYAVQSASDPLEIPAVIDLHG